MACLETGRPTCVTDTDDATCQQVKRAARSGYVAISIPGGQSWIHPLLRDGAHQAACHTACGRYGMASIRFQFNENLWSGIARTTNTAVPIDSCAANGPRAPNRKPRFGRECLQSGSLAAHTSNNSASLALTSVSGLAAWYCDGETPCRPGPSPCAGIVSASHEIMV